ncbi:MAG: hypothetical protein HUU16_19275 [Candidatus Omnitrophica bacterium]|nr:hypothetical protein [Candidatus Omnitrophota bacterium]
MPHLRIEQIAPKLGRLEDNLRLHADLLAKASEEGVDLLVFPELSLTGYLLKDLVSEVAQGSETLLNRLRAATPSVRNLEAAIGFVEESPGHRFHNSTLVVRWDERAVPSVVHIHRKVYLPTYGLFDEGRYFTPGKTLRTFETQCLGRCGILICEDAWHLSLPLLLALDGPRLEGAGALIIPSNSPARGVGEAAQGIPESYRIWDRLLATYATLLEVCVIYAGRGGVEDGLTFSGGSQVISPTGESLGKAKHFESDRLDVTLDWPGLLRMARASSLVSASENVDLLKRELERIAIRGVDC